MSHHKSKRQTWRKRGNKVIAVAVLLSICQLIANYASPTVTNYQLGSYHYVSGVDASSSATLAAYLNSLNYSLVGGAFLNFYQILVSGSLNFKIRMSLNHGSPNRMHGVSVLASIGKNRSVIIEG